MPHFIALTILVLIGTVFLIIERCSKGGYFNLSASAAASEFCKWVQVGIDACTPHHKYQVKPRISPWFSAACAPVILQRNHFFVRINRVNLLNLK